MKLTGFAWLQTARTENHRKPTKCPETSGTMVTYGDLPWCHWFLDCCFVEARRAPSQSAELRWDVADWNHRSSPRLPRVLDGTEDDKARGWKQKPSETLGSVPMRVLLVLEGTGSYWPYLGGNHMGVFHFRDRITWKQKSMMIWNIWNRGSAEWSWDNREGYREEIDSLAPSLAYLKTYKNHRCKGKRCWFCRKGFKGLLMTGWWFHNCFSHFSIF